MPGQIDLNKNGGERDFGPFSSDDREDISASMKEAIETLKTMEFPQDDDAVKTEQEKPEQPQDTPQSDEQIKH